MLISVTQDHIDGARRLLQTTHPMARNCVCPVALAVREATGEEWRIMTSLASLTAGRWTRLSRSARRWIARFDNWKAVEPFTFRFTEIIR